MSVDYISPFLSEYYFVQDLLWIEAQVKFQGGIPLQSLMRVSHHSCVASLNRDTISKISCICFRCEYLMIPRQLTPWYLARFDSFSTEFLPSDDLLRVLQNGTCLFNGVSAASYLADSRIRIELERYLDRVVAEGTIFELRLITYKTFPSRVGASGNGQNGHNRWGWYCDGITTLYTIILPFCNLIG